MSIPKLIIEENILYCDLDGVLVDFEKGVKERMKKYPHELNQTNMWITLRKTPNFYANLPWMPEGKALWDAIKIYNPVILTGCPRGGWSEDDKRSWCARELGADIKVICCETKNKPDFCTEGDVLIDDRDVIMDKWIAKKGKYVHYAEGKLEEYINLIKEYLS
jgi:hypothetical protein